MCDDGNVNSVLTDNVHGVAKYTVVLHSMEFMAYAFNWPIPDDHNIYINDLTKVVNSFEKCCQQ